MEIKQLNWYLSKDLKTLTSVQRMIVKEMRVIRIKKRHDYKEELSFNDSINKSKKHLKSKNYKNDIIELIINKVYYTSQSIFDVFWMIGLNYNKPKIKVKKFHTYIFKDVSGRFKIGKSTNPIDRHKNLETINKDLKVIFIFNCDIESKLHNMFDKKHIGNEWFLLSEDDLELIYNKYCKNEYYLK